ncbi:MAG: site-specific DNA-methyltransferase [Brevibacterium aurantiacum]
MNNDFSNADSSSFSSENDEIDGLHRTEPGSPNFRTELAAQLAELVPEAIADGQVDVEKLRELLDGDVADTSERFGLFWPGKKQAQRMAQEPTTATLRPDKANSKDWDTTKNVFIEGDNLEVLKILQKHYHNKIKMIYIDPPYNTGKDFVYKDNFRDGIDTYLEWTQQVNEEGKKLSTNSDSEGRYHSNWLNMMYPRLKLARNLLADDGVIFISIDDNEHPNLRRIADEIFGENNFISNVVWQKKFSRSNDATYFSTMHDHILCYAKRNIVDSQNGWKIGLLPRGEEIPKGYGNPDDDRRGNWTSVALQAKSGGSSTVYEIMTPSGRRCVPPNGRYWSVSKARFDDLVADGRIWFGKNGDGTPRLKTFLSEVQQGLRPNSMLLHSEAGHNQLGKQETKKLFDGIGVFDGPKPVKLISLLSEIANLKSDSLVLDFFAGSGSLAHAIMQFNAESGKYCSSISVQLPEPTPLNSEASRAGYASVAEIARERICRGGESVTKECVPGALNGESFLDTGFRSYTLIDTNFSKWKQSSDVEPSLLERKMLELRNGSSADEATGEDLLTEILLKQGYSLTETIGADEVAGLDVRLVLDETGDVSVLAYLDEHTKPTLDQLRAFVDEKPGRIIILEDAFEGDDELKTNLAQLCKSRDIELWTA